MFQHVTSGITFKEVNGKISELQRFLIQLHLDESAECQIKWKEEKYWIVCIQDNAVDGYVVMLRWDKGRIQNYWNNIKNQTWYKNKIPQKVIEYSDMEKSDVEQFKKQLFQNLELLLIN
jgi:hypothetical protein